jgi:molecular chaperone DnaJ
MGKDYYEILGVAKDAGDDEIRKSYRKLARKYHPDVNPGDKKAEERFKEISTAYQVLSDEERRKQYDMFGEAGPGGGAPPGGGGGPGGFRFSGFDFGGGGGPDLGGLFADLFGGGGPAEAARRGPVRGRDLHHTVRLSFMDAVQGTKLTLEVPRKVACDTCGGSATAPGSSPAPCQACGGSGRTSFQKSQFQFSSVCPQCGGTGEHATPCPACSGEGTRPRTDKIKVAIPPGVDTGSTVRVSGKGDAGSAGAPPGDLLLSMRVDPHPFFERKGSNLYLDLPLTYAEAALGAKVEVPTLEGTATIRIPPGTQTGQRFRLTGRGVPSRGGARGDLYAVATITVPEVVEESSKDLLRSFAEKNPESPRDRFGGGGDA